MIMIENNGSGKETTDEDLSQHKRGHWPSPASWRRKWVYNVPRRTGHHVEGDAVNIQF